MGARGLEPPNLTDVNQKLFFEQCGQQGSRLGVAVLVSGWLSVTVRAVASMRVHYVNVRSVLASEKVDQEDYQDDDDPGAGFLG